MPRSNCQLQADFQTNSLAASVVFSSCAPRSVELSVDISSFEQGFYQKILQFGQSYMNVTPTFNTQAKPMLVVRLLEYIQFKGSHCEPCVTGQLVSVPVVSNLETAFQIFDSSVGFQPHRVRLKAPTAPKQVTFEDLELDFVNLVREFTAPSQEHCAATDSAGVCLRCSLGFFFSADGLSCTKCGGFYVASLDSCLPDTSLDASAGHKVFAGALELRMFDYLSSQTGDVQFASFFGSRPADPAHLLSESLPTDDTLEYSFRIRLTLSATDSLRNIDLPSYYFLQFSGFPGLLGQLADVVSKPDPKTLVYELYLGYSASNGPQKSNYVLPLPNAFMFGKHGMSYDLRVTYIAYDYENLMVQHFDAESGLVPIQTRSTSISVSRRGPFWLASQGTSDPEKGFQLFFTNNQAIRFKVACFEGCDYCSIDRMCEICSPGFYLESGSCEKCSKECTTCQGHPQNCHSCADPSIALDQSTPSFV